MRLPRRFRRQYRDPVTGDSLTTGEWCSWRLQGIIRNWWWLAVITFATVTIWVYTAIEVGIGLRTGTVALLTWWNLCASYLALLIEGTVGIALFSQTRRDAVYIRKIESIARHQEIMLADLQTALAALAALVKAHEEHYGKPILPD